MDGIVGGETPSWYEAVLMLPLPTNAPRAFFGEWPGLSRESAMKINDGISMLLAHQHALRDYAARKPLTGSVFQSHDVPLPVDAMLHHVATGNKALLALLAMSSGSAAMNPAKEARLARAWHKGVLSFFTVMAVMTDAKVSSRAVGYGRRDRLLRAVETWRKAVAVWRSMPVTETHHELVAPSPR